MPSRKDSPNRSETFGRLLSGAINSIATYEGKTAPIIEEELGALVIVAGKTIQRYKAGALPPEYETVKVLAEAAVRRGFLDREWLQRFLHAARYPFADTLLDQLRPIGPARVRPPRVYENLPAPTYSQFVMRPQAFADVIDGLQQRSAVVLIVGLGGNGKTSLAREVAARCLQDDGDVSRFDAVVWVSDKDRPGTTNLSVVLSEIARTLDYPGFTQFAQEEKLYEVGQLLKRLRVLVVVDNFETITDSALLTWLLRLPEPSKALITSREYSRAFRNSTIVAELRSMGEMEAREFIGQRLHVLRIEKLVSDPAQLAPLLLATGGNPKAIEIALGIVKHERRPLQQVVDDLYAALGDLFGDLFTRAWSLLDEAARRVLLVMTFFQDSASNETLSATADVQGFAFDRAVERLTDLALLDIQQVDLTNAPRYTLHPLVRAFAGAKLAQMLEFEEKAKERWVTWYVNLVSKVGWCWQKLEQLNLLDPEQETIYAVARWTLANRRYTETISISKGVDYYYYVRGFWNKKLTLNLMRIEAARNLNDKIEESQGLAFYVEVLSKQGNITEAAKHLLRLEELTQVSQLSEGGLWNIKFAKAFYLMACQRFGEAMQIWEESLRREQDIPMRSTFSRRWLATCLYQMGEVAKAREIFHEALCAAIRLDHQGAILFCKIKLARIELEQGNLDVPEVILLESREQASKHHNRVAQAEGQYLAARLHTLRGDLPAARAALTEAIDLFERLGMRRELAEARAALTDLDARELAEAAG